MNKPNLLAVFAHPDDEAFRCGGTLSLLAKSGVHVHILTFTRGQAGSCGRPPICAREDLGAVRTAELLCSCRTLGLETPQILDYEDGRLADVVEEEGVVWIADCIKAIRPQVLLTWPLDGLSGHLDHITVSQWRTVAYHQAKNEGIDELIALYHLAMPDSLAMDLEMKHLHTIADNDVTVTVNVQGVWEEKVASIACHRTQAGESPILQAPLEQQMRFLGWEHFNRYICCQTEDMFLKFNSQEGKVNTD